MGTVWSLAWLEPHACWSQSRRLQTPEPRRRGDPAHLLGGPECVCCCCYTDCNLFSFFYDYHYSSPPWFQLFILVLYFTFLRVSLENIKYVVTQRGWWTLWDSSSRPLLCGFHLSSPVQWGNLLQNTLA